MKATLRPLVKALVVLSILTMHVAAIGLIAVSVAGAVDEGEYAKAFGIILGGAIGFFTASLMLMLVVEDIGGTCDRCGR